VEVVKTATPAAGEFLQVLAVFVAVVGLWLGFHCVGVRDLGVINQLEQLTLDLSDFKAIEDLTNWLQRTTNL
jgi:hypothetical protein